jgi:hypothetical protein
MTFTPAELAAADDAFRVHRNGDCPGDCGFCYDLELAGPEWREELIRIRRLKNNRETAKLVGNRAKSRQGAAPLANISKNQTKRRAKVQQQMDSDRRYHAQMCRPEKPRHDPYS